MRIPLLIIAVTGWLSVATSADPTWHLVGLPGKGCWPPRCQEGQVPLATPVVSHAGRLFMLGDGAAPNQVYESEDGTTWRAATHDAGWGARYGASDASFAGALWRMGGFIDSGNARTPMNDVWRSVDGRRWERLLEHAPWPPRSGARLVAFRDKLWLVGGDPHDGKIWETTDGRAWRPHATATLPRATPQGVLVFKDALWIVGHGRWDSARNDVWRSADGITWSRVTASAEWSPRTPPGVAVRAPRLWVVGGADHRDVWSSSDGRGWQRDSAELPGPPRGAEYCVVFRNRFWVFGGKTGGNGGTGFWDGVCYFTEG